MRMPCRVVVVCQGSLVADRAVFGRLRMMMFGLSLRLDRNDRGRGLCRRIRGGERLRSGLRRFRGSGGIGRARRCGVSGCRRFFRLRSLFMKRRLFHRGGSGLRVLAEQGALGNDFGDELLGFAAGGAVANGHDPNLILGNQVLEQDLGVRPAVLGRMGVDDALIQKIAAGIEHRELAARPEARIDRQHGLLRDRRLEQQAAQVLGENVDRMLLGAIGEVAPDLALHAGHDQPVQGIDRRRAKELGVGMAVQRKLSEEGALDIRAGQLQPDLERPLLVAAIDGEHAVGRNLGKRLRIVKIIAIFEALALRGSRLWW